MKKLLKIIGGLALVLAMNVSTVSAASGTWAPSGTSGTGYVGDANNIKCWWSKGWSIAGDKMEATMEGYGNQKKVTAKVGSDSTTSGWVASTKNRAQAYDKGPWGGSYSVRFEYK